ncbi:hypothetical protein [Hyalangium rubrum]|uniref:Flp pilus-assembly TadG-like N-terminal domain-containing protein n=1 Tax=Hyalangium rubrum TaxID=3103134 RepID=A0ABU5HCQ4_9BACT|nr:hypothetical protein [Hyalangium sp. s54d21]MDY7231246.1 hypothetical protein [Hyalangium sp. s54d21]
MKNLPHSRRSPARSRGLRARGQTMILGAVSLLILALIVFVTFNVTVAVQQKIKVQNYSDAKAFSMAVAEARTLNYMAYTNRAIASAYVGMANASAYMSEAAILADLKFGASQVMGTIAGIESGLCYCCWAGPCCIQHCWHATEAGINSAGLLIDYFTGKMGGKLRKLDAPFRQTMQALNAHVDVIHLSQTAAQGQVAIMLMGGTFANLKRNNMQKADQKTEDDMMVAALNINQWQKVFYSNKQVKQRIMAETVNATRHDFTWNRTGGNPITLFPPNWVADNVKASLWMGPKGTWGVAQTPFPGAASGRTGFVDSNIGGFGGFTQDAPAGTTRGQTVASTDWGTLAGTWRHGAGASTLPFMAPIANASSIRTGNSTGHSGGFMADFTNSIHNGSHGPNQLDLGRFVEFDIGTSAPFNQPAVYAAVTTDSRYNEYGKRGPWEIKKDESGVLTVKGVGSQDGRLAIANNNPTKAFSKAMVYYHRIGDWSDYPNIFNPYWRAKLDTVSQTELAMALGIFDTDALTVATGARSVNSSAVNISK